VFILYFFNKTKNNEKVNKSALKEQRRVVYV